MAHGYRQVLQSKLSILTGEERKAAANSNTEHSTSAEIASYTTTWISKCHWPALKLVQDGIDVRSRSTLGSWFDLADKSMSRLPATSPVTKVLRSGATTARQYIYGFNRLPFQVIPPILAQGLTSGVLAVSRLFRAAAEEDKLGFTNHFVPTVLVSLIGVTRALQEYKTLVAKYHTLLPQEHAQHRVEMRLQDDAVATSPAPAPAAAARPTLPGDAVALSDAAEAALDDLLRNFRDYLALYTFSYSQNDIIQQRLRAMKL